MNVSSARHVIFDFDGVLGDTGELNYGIVRELHPEVVREQYFRDHHLGNVYENPQHVGVPFTPTSSVAYFATYAERLGAAHVAAAVAPVRALQRAYTLHIVTSNCEDAITQALAESGIGDSFCSILGRQAHQSKVEKWQRIAAEYDIELTESVYVTDTVGDVCEAQRVGLPTIAVTFGYHDEALLAAYEPDHIAHSWDAVLEAIDTRLRSCMVVGS